MAFSWRQKWRKRERGKKDVVTSASIEQDFFGGMQFSRGIFFWIFWGEMFSEIGPVQGREGYNKVPAYMAKMLRNERIYLGQKLDA